MDIHNQRTEAAARLKEKKHLDKIYPVLRSRSHPLQDNQGLRLIHAAHTAESWIFYCVDMGDSYVLIDEEMAGSAGYAEEEIRGIALSNIKKLDTSYKKDEVAGNAFYFFSQRDGYAASRILNEELLAFMRRKIHHVMAAAIPHQDVLIVADLANEAGYKILFRMNMEFCMKGNVPISPLPFLYGDNQELEPMIIVANSGVPHNKPAKRE